MNGCFYVSIYRVSIGWPDENFSCTALPAICLRLRHLRMNLYPQISQIYTDKNLERQGRVNGVEG
jgi:hypothetical protein